jgi:arylsulfatase A
MSRWPSRLKRHLRVQELDLSRLAFHKFIASYSVRINRRLVRGFWFVLIAAIAVAPCASAAKPRTPNVVVLLADDLGYGDLTCYGCPDARTPNLDRMASEGAKFTDAYASAPVCSPTRVALLTGQYQQRQGNAFEAYLGGGSPGLDGTKQKTLAALLKGVGYETVLLGKWNVSGSEGGREENNPAVLPTAHGFAHWICVHHNHDQHTHRREKSDVYDLWQDGKRLDRAGFTDDFLTDDAVAFITKPRQTPFFLYLPFLSPHNPLQTHDDPKRHPNGDRATYVKMVERLDHNVGRVLDAIRRAGIANETLVIFTSDNGGQIAGRNLPLSGRKLQLLEGGIRVPLLVWQPGTVTPGRVIEYPVITMDITATALAVAAAKVPDGQTLDGIDLTPLVTGNVSPEPRTLFWRSRKINHRARTNEVDARAVRDADWKLYWRGNKPKLFNLRNDVAESRDLSAERPALVETLAAKLAAWEKQVSPQEELYAR